MATIHPYHEESTKKLLDTTSDEWQKRNKTRFLLGLILMITWASDIPEICFGPAKSSLWWKMNENEAQLKPQTRNIFKLGGCCRQNEDMTNSFPTTFPYVLQFESIRDGQTCREHVSFERLLVLGPFSPWHPADHRKNSEKRPVWKSLPALG